MLANMAIGVTSFLIVILGFARAAPAVESVADIAAATKEVQSKDDLNPEASSYARSYSDWGGAGGGGGGYNSYVVGYGLLDVDKYSHGTGSYDNNPYRGYDRGYSGYSGYAGNDNYGGYRGYTGYDQGSVGGYGISSLAGNGGYGGYGGNGGINSYYGYGSPSYQGGHHLGYGYYNKKPGYGNIYNTGITPSLVTGYRGYSRR